MGKAESVGASAMQLDSQLKPINQETVDYYTPMLFKIIYTIFQS